MAAHANGRVYLDYQASTPLDPRVIAAMMPYFGEKPGNPHATDHSFGWEAAKAVELAAQQVATAIGADPDEVIFTSGATEANNLAIIGIAGRKPPSRKRILVSSIEHKSVLATAAATRRLGLKVELIPVDREGVVRVDQFSRQLSDDVLLVSVMAVNNEVGTIEPIGQVAELCHATGALFHTDATQALTTEALDVGVLQADLLSLSAHKIYGPMGIGALYMRRDIQRQIEPLFYGGGQQHGLRAGTLPVPLCVGFGEAAAICAYEGEVERTRIRNLREEFFQELQRIVPRIKLNGPTGIARHVGNISVCFPGIEADVLLGALQPQVAASTGSACTSGTIEPSHVLRSIGLNHDEANSSIRFSIGRFTTGDEVSRAADAVDRALSRLGPATR